MKHFQLIIKYVIIFYIFSFSNKVMSQQDSKIDSVSYSLGVMIAQNLMDQGFTKLNSSDFALAVSDVMEGKEPRINAGLANKILNEEIGNRQAELHKDNKQAGEKFLEENAKRSEVTVLPNGVQYEIIRAADGPTPKLTDKVKVHYHGTLVNGKVFDSSVERGQSISFPVNGVIQGWQEVLQIMPVGSKWKAYIPYNLAYGERGAGSDIKPFSALIFEIELLEIE